MHNPYSYGPLLQPRQHHLRNHERGIQQVGQAAPRRLWRLQLQRLGRTEGRTCRYCLLICWSVLMQYWSDIWKAIKKKWRTLKLRGRELVANFEDYAHILFLLQICRMRDTSKLGYQTASNFGVQSQSILICVCNKTVSRANFGRKLFWNIFQQNEDPQVLYTAGKLWVSRFQKKSPNVYWLSIRILMKQWTKLDKVNCAKLRLSH